MFIICSNKRRCPNACFVPVCYAGNSEWGSLRLVQASRWKRPSCYVETKQVRIIKNFKIDMILNINKFLDL